MKRKFIMLLAATLAFSLLAYPALAASSFPDVNEEEAYAEAVEFLYSRGLMVGDNQGNFNPDNAVSRAEMATIVCRLLGVSEHLSVSEQFSDVPASHWANAYVGKAAELGIVNGYGDGSFGPSDTVTYEQALTMLVRAMGLEDEAIAAGGYPDGYIDVACEYGYTDWLSAEKGDPLSRWQTSMILNNVLHSIL